MYRQKMRLISAVGIVAAALVLAPKTVEAQPDPCQQCWQTYIGGIQFHGYFKYEGSPIMADCGPTGCHPEWVEYFCDAHGHDTGGCQTEDSLQDALSLILEVDATDPDQLAALVAMAPDRIRLNPDRGALQLYDCDGHVTASWPVPSTAVPTLR